MLESEIKKLTAAVTELTATINGGAISTIPAKSEPANDAQETPSLAPAAAPTPAPEVNWEAPTQDAAAATVESPPAEVKVPTKKQLVEKFIELAQEKDREVAVKLLADFGVSKLPELTDKTKWASFIVAVDALLA